MRISKQIYMEITENKIPWLNPAHPNYERWLRGRQLAHDRAEVVMQLISSEINCTKLKILDLGSGEGGTSSYFSENNYVVSFDLSIFRLKRQQGKVNYPLISGRAECLPFCDSSFDLIILQDVLEHTAEADLVAAELKRVLKTDGIAYLSTPNKFSVLNIIADPHWGIPFLSLFKRDFIKKYFLRFFRKNDLRRDDIAELLSIRDLKKLFSEFTIKLKTNEMVKLLSDSPAGILWSNFHISLYGIFKKFHLNSALIKTANNKAGIVNALFTPTFYAVLRKR